MSAVSSPSHMVEVRARVSGYLDKVHFQDGQLVKEGDLLFTIDKRPFQNTLAQARANLETAKSNLTFTEADLGRGRQLLRDRTISEQVFEQRSQAFRNAQAAVAANEAHGAPGRARSRIHRAQGPDRRAHRRPPRDARQSGDRRHRRHHHAARRHRLDRSDPTGIHLRRSLAACATSGWRGTAAPNSPVGNTPVRLRLIDEQDFSHYGRMDFVDNVVDRATGTIRGRAQFANADGLFTPGMFARVQVPGSAPYQALLVPDAAIGTEQARKYVLVVNADDVVTQKYVTLGEVVDGLRVIKSGISGDDRVIVAGLMRARAGGKVAPQEEGAPPQASGPRSQTN